MQGTTEIVYISGIHDQPIQKRIACRHDLSSIGFLDSAPDPTNADSVPPTSYFDSSWSCADWMAWHKANVVKYGQAVANAAFIKYWEMQGGFANDYNWCKYQSDFFNYFKNQGIDTGWWFSHLFVDATQIVDSAGTAATNVATSASNATGVLKWLLPVSVVALVIGGGIYLKHEFIDNSKGSAQRVSGKKKKYGKK